MYIVFKVIIGLIATVSSILVMYYNEQIHQIDGLYRGIILASGLSVGIMIGYLSAFYFHNVNP